MTGRKSKWGKSQKRSHICMKTISDEAVAGKKKSLKWNEPLSFKVWDECNVGSWKKKDPLGLFYYPIPECGIYTSHYWALCPKVVN